MARKPSNTRRPAKPAVTGTLQGRAAIGLKATGTLTGSGALAGRATTHNATGNLVGSGASISQTGVRARQAKAEALAELVRALARNDKKRGRNYRIAQTLRDQGYKISDNRVSEILNPKATKKNLR